MFSAETNKFRGSIVSNRNFSTILRVSRVSQWAQAFKVHRSKDRNTHHEHILPNLCAFSPARNWKMPCCQTTRQSGGVGMPKTFSFQKCRIFREYSGANWHYIVEKIWVCGLLPPALQIPSQLCICHKGPPHSCVQAGLLGPTRTNVPAMGYRWHPTGGRRELADVVFDNHVLQASNKLPRCNSNQSRCYALLFVVHGQEIQVQATIPCTSGLPTESHFHYMNLGKRYRGLTSWTTAFPPAMSGYQRPRE